MNLTAFLNVSSLLLGLLAWGVPFLAVAHRSRFALCCIGSFACCGLSLLFQLFELRHRVALEDWSALLDTAPAVTLAASVLFVGVLGCNLFVLLHRTRR